MASPLHFIGRDRDMARLQRQLDTVTEDGRGQLLSIRGRRQAGKSRLVTEFADRTGLPQLFFTGARLAQARAELARFELEAASSSLPGASLFDGRGQRRLDPGAAEVRLRDHRPPPDLRASARQGVRRGRP